MLKILNTVKKILILFSKDKKLPIRLCATLKDFGIEGVVNQLKAKMHEEFFYRQVKYIYKTPQMTDVIKTELSSFAYKPLISIVMPVYNVDPKWLDLAIKSIKKQWYDNWELCIADDKSTNQDTIGYLRKLNHPKIKVKFLDKNLNISGASNEALDLAIGDYIALMDNDDEITPDAFYEVVKAINDTGAEFIYSDEDKLEMNGDHSDPHYKPDYSVDMMFSQNYICHLTCIKTSLAKAVDGFHIGFEGSQDHDLFLRVLEKTDKVYHIQKVLYHWRKIPGSTAHNMDEKSYAWEAGRKAVEEALKRRGINGRAMLGYWPGSYIARRDIVGNPLVSIIIPFKDKPELLKMCMESILQKTSYNNFEVIGISNNSIDPSTFDLMEYYASLDQRVRFYEYNVPFNYSRINNYAAMELSKGEHIVLLNNDIEIITTDWIEVMLEHSQREGVGAVGARLYYPNDTIQHAGVFVGVGGIANHSHRHVSRFEHGYFSKPYMIQNLSAVTAACMMVKKELYLELGGLNEKQLPVAFNDVDFCLRLREKGFLNVYTPLCEAYHHESVTRGYDYAGEAKKRLDTESEYMESRHAEILKNGDPYYNPNLITDQETLF